MRSSVNWTPPNSLFRPTSNTLIRPLESGQPIMTAREKLPIISVVIPARNEAEHLPSCLAALRHQREAPSFELIVVDNGSTDETALVAQRFGARVISERRPGVAQARQTGFAAARGEIIASTDADSVVPPSWLGRLMHALHRHPDAVAVGGPVRYSFAEPILTEAFDRTIPILHAVDRWLHDGRPHLIGANFAVRRSAFEIIGGFRTDLELAEDLDLSHRLHSVGALQFLPKLVVMTSDRRFRRTGPSLLFRYLKSYVATTQPSAVHLVRPTRRRGAE